MIEGLLCRCSPLGHCLTLCVPLPALLPPVCRALEDAEEENSALRQELVQVQHKAALQGAQLRVLTLGGTLPPHSLQVVARPPQRALSTKD